MSLSIDGSSLYNSVVSSVSDTKGKANSLQETLSSVDTKDATDVELLDACKSFETYFIEQGFKEMKKTRWTAIC